MRFMKRQTHDHTICHPLIRWTACCIGSAASFTRTSKGPAAIAVATAATDKNRRPSSRNDGGDYVRCFSRTEGIHQWLRGEIRGQEVSYAIQPEGSRARLDQGP